MADLIRHLIEVMTIRYLVDTTNRIWQIKYAMTRVEQGRLFTISMGASLHRANDIKLLSSKSNPMLEKLVSHEKFLVAYKFFLVAYKFFLAPDF